MKPNDTLWRDDPIQVSPNPMTRVFGFAPEVTIERGVDPERGAWHRYTGPQCGSCAFLTSHVGSSHRFYKCEKRGVTNGAATDHRVRWPACGLYKPTTNDVCETCGAYKCEVHT